MLKVIFQFPKTADLAAVDDFIATYVVPPLQASPGFRSMSMNSEPLMSPMGPPPYCRVVEATLADLDDFMEIGRSELIAESRAHAPEGFLITMYEFSE